MARSLSRMMAWRSVGALTGWRPRAVGSECVGLVRDTASRLRRRSVAIGDTRDGSRLRRHPPGPRTSPRRCRMAARAAQHRNLAEAQTAVAEYQRHSLESSCFPGEIEKLTVGQMVLLGLSGRWQLSTSVDVGGDVLGRQARLNAYLNTAPTSWWVLRMRLADRPVPACEPSTDRLAIHADSSA